MSSEVRSTFPIFAPLGPVHSPPRLLTPPGLVGCEGLPASAGMSAGAPENTPPRWRRCAVPWHVCASPTPRAGAPTERRIHPGKSVETHAPRAVQAHRYQLRGWRRAKLCDGRSLSSRRPQGFAIRQPRGQALGIRDQELGKPASGFLRFPPDTRRRHVARAWAQSACLRGSKNYS
jgi:hypothetical protein